MNARDPIAEATWRLDAGHPAEALEALRDADPLDPYAAALRSRALADVGKPDEAEEEARRGLALDPEHTLLLEMLAAAQMLRDARAAEQTVEEALALEPENERLLGLRVIVLVEQKRFEAAERALARLMAVAPESEMARRVRTLFLANASYSDEAMAAARALLQDYPDDAYAHYLQGLVLLNKQWWRGLRHLREAARLRPQDPVLAETARAMRAWYVWPAHLTSGAAGAAIAICAGIITLVLLILEDPRWWYPLAANVALTANRWIVHFAVQARLQRRVTRALREMYG